MIICAQKTERFLCANYSFCRDCLFKKDADNMLNYNITDDKYRNL